MSDELAILLQAVQAAGEAILAVQKQGITIARKAHNEIVTKADILANDILKTQLLTAFPADGWLSEESVDAKERLQCQRVWIVDPIDGTKEFASGVPEYAISVALVEKGIPVLAAVFNPATQELFYAVKGQGAWLNHEKLNKIHASPTDHLLFLASRSEYARHEWDKYKPRHRITQVGSIAYKLALIAAGVAPVTFSLTPKNEWDVAAGVLLVTEVGGIVTDKHRQAFLFNRKVVEINGIVATAAEVNDYVFALFDE